MTPSSTNPHSGVTAAAAVAGNEAARYDRERSAHNKIFGEQTRKTAEKFYSIVHASRALYERALVARCADAHALEYGCGAGSHSQFLVRNGAARVVGIDISDVAIEQARASAAQRGMTRLEHFRMNAESLEFASDSFDLICGTAILHHLDLPRAFSELARTLRPSGTAVFMEPLGHNPLINFYRRLTPGLRTVDEHPLLMTDLRLARTYFADVRLHYFVLQSLLAVPFRQRRYFRRLLGALEAADRTLFKVLPFTGRFAWQVVIVLQQPIKATS